MVLSAHGEYLNWIGHIFDEWLRLLELPEANPDRNDIIEDFREAYDELAQTVPDLPPFDNITRMLMRAFRLTSIEEVNARSGQTPTIDWSRAYGWILVGGQAMDRGFTVEGLTVTYMPRSPGAGNADAIQQRARFFGYKRAYLGFPPQDIPSDDNPLAEPPPSLLDALRVFLTGVAAGLLQGRSAQNARRSMLVHPSRTTERHREYLNWIGHIFDEWLRLLELPEANPDRNDIIEDFREAYDELAQTVPDLPPFDNITRMLMRAFRLTSIEEVNARSGQTPTIDWSRAYGWILVGGQAMDRGFTVEGLTVTYMPRSPGAGNADAIQQRARFFGYKRAYLGFCRIYLEQNALTAFEQYVTHEEEMRAQLQDFRTSGQPLRDWKRVFVLSRDLRPCRDNVIQYDYARGRYAAQWFFPRMASTPEEVTEENRRILSEFEDGLNFVRDTTFESEQPAQQHFVCESVPLSAVLSELLVPYRISDAADTREMTGMLLQLSKALEQDQDETVVVYKMRPTYQGERDVDATGRITSIRRLFQGPTRVRGDGGQTYSYPGDMAFRDDDRVAVQIHHYDLKHGGGLR